METDPTVPAPIPPAPQGGVGAPYPPERLREELAAFRLEDPQDLLAFLPLAARLAALGDPSQLGRWPAEARRLGANLDELLPDRAREGIWDLTHARGGDLGQAVVWAQDFACLLALQGDLLPEPSRLALRVWAREAEEAALDQAAVDDVELFLQTFPIPQAYRLAVVHAPMSLAEKALLAARRQGRRTIETQWTRVEQPTAPAEAEEAAGVGGALLPLGGASAARPAERLKRHFHATASAEVPGVGVVSVERQVTDNWMLLLYVECQGEGGAPATMDRFERVRAGLLGARPVRDGNPTEWYVDLNPYAHEDRLRLMEQPISISFRQGPRLKVR